MRPASKVGYALPMAQLLPMSDEMMASFGSTFWIARHAMRGLIRSGAVDLAPVVTHRFALDDYEAAFELMQSGECGKVVLFPDPEYADGPLS